MCVCVCVCVCVGLVGFYCILLGYLTPNPLSAYTGWNDKIIVLKKTTLQLYFKTFIEKINSANLIM